VTNQLLALYLCSPQSHNFDHAIVICHPLALCYIVFYDWSTGCEALALEESACWGKECVQWYSHSTSLEDYTNYDDNMDVFHTRYCVTCGQTLLHLLVPAKSHTLQLSRQHLASVVSLSYP
jgi:hypothetical protein